MLGEAVHSAEVKGGVVKPSRKSVHVYWHVGELWFVMSKVTWAAPALFPNPFQPEEHSQDQRAVPLMWPFLRCIETEFALCLGIF